MGDELVVVEEVGVVYDCGHIFVMANQVVLNPTSTDDRASTSFCLPHSIL
jgi:hypothetical protein